MKTLLFLLLFPTLGLSHKIFFIGESCYSSTDIYKFTNNEGYARVIFNFNSIRFTRINKYGEKSNRIAKNPYYDTTLLLNNFYN